MEYGDSEREEEHRNSEENTAENAGPNNSIIDKMRSSVSSILPNSLSKWFSPSSASNNDATNGSYITNKRARLEPETNTPHARADRRSEMARRRIEVDDYEEDDGDGLDDEEAAEESNNSDDIPLVNTSTNFQRRKHLNVISPADQPPSKRSRMTFDGTMLSSRPLIASTPSINAQQNSGILNNHYGHLNLYAGVNRKELAYNFYSATPSSSNFEQQSVAPDIIDLIPIPISSGDYDVLNVRKANQNTDTESSSSRRALNIPPTTAKSLGPGLSSSVLPSLKRQSLNSVRAHSSTTDSKQIVDMARFDHKNDSITVDQAQELDEMLLGSQSYNGSVQSKFQNGVADFDEDLRRRSVTYSEAEDTDTIGDLPINASIHSNLKSGIVSQRAASSGLFNMSTGNSRSGSRASSFGNGLNFYTHLEGRKSLFSGNNSGTRSGNQLNTSTFSLNSLSRRQFNASIYGSTSALSDSRLLNTSSPFYKGNTTYGGASAYSKYATSLGSNTRLTPTLIRPTSSLSTLSSSSNSIVAGAGVPTTHGEQNPAISGTAKTILDLLNGFTTPLSEAKKMATSLRQQPITSTVTQTSKSKRLNDDDLHASRAMRLQQVRTPYMRPTVMLQPRKYAHDMPIPPVRELQVPSMSQLLQMKKLQSLTERSRQITMQKSNNECSFSTLDITRNTNAKISNCERSMGLNLPTTAPLEQPKEINVFENIAAADCKQQKHVNKIKHKIANTLRTPDIPDESPPIPANLPNIAFPLMAEMPKIDITLPTCKTFNSKPIEIEVKNQKLNNVSVVESDVRLKADGYKFSSPVKIKDIPASVLGIEPSKVNFEFSKPTPLETGSSDIKMTKESENDRPNKQTSFFVLPTPTVPTAVPILKTGSVLDALKKTFVLPKTAESPKSNHQLITSEIPSSFGSKFLKAADEWECDTCMIRNKESVNKCIVCENPRKGAVAPATILQKQPTCSAPITPFAAGFGDQFKKIPGEWECDTCMVRNKPELDKCVSCETLRKTQGKLVLQTELPRPFGQSNFEKSVKSMVATAVSSDSGFKSLAAAQQASKWECEACMTLNESSRSKCACCEQPKPGSESQKENAPSFNFGATAASKFSFGFSAAAPDPAKVNELRLEDSNVSKIGDKSAEALAGSSQGFTFGTGKAVVTTQSNSFSFGFPTKSNTTLNQFSAVASKDVSDTSNKAPALSFGFVNPISIKSNENIIREESSAISTATASSAAASATATAVSSIASFTSPNAMQLGNTITTSSLSGAALKKPQEFPFDTLSATNSAVSTTTTMTRSSGGKLSFPTVITTTIESSTPPKNVSFTNTNSGIVLTSATSTTTTSKPMFSFGGPSLSVSSTGNVSSSSMVTSTTTTASVVTNTTNVNSGMIGFNFMNPATSVVASTTTSANSSQFALTSNANSNTSQSSNTFAVLGSTKSNSQPVSMTPSTTAEPTFAGFSFGAANMTTAKIESANLFGAQSTKTKTESKPTALAAPFFGNAAPQPASKTATSNTWPKTAFLFGNAASTETAPAGTAASNESSKPVFGSAKVEATESKTPVLSNSSSATSIFGNVGSSSSTSNFGNSGSTSTVIFGTESAVAPTQTITNLFSSNNNTSIPQFGIMRGGQSALGNNLSLNNTSGFGSTAPVSFGTFGATAAANTTGNTTKTETDTQQSAAPFAFGAPQTQSTSSGFNFGTNGSTSKPAFNFSSTNQPTFNFTGGFSNTKRNSTQPFHFGAIAAPSFNAPPVFSFGGAPSTETTSNTPFQFNAGNSPATSNIFAPAPTASTTTPTARRKVRIATRRIPPR